MQQIIAGAVHTFGRERGPSPHSLQKEAFTEGLTRGAASTTKKAKGPSPQSLKTERQGTGAKTRFLSKKAKGPCPLSLQTNKTNRGTCCIRSPPDGRSRQDTVPLTSEVAPSHPLGTGLPGPSTMLVTLTEAPLQSGRLPFSLKGSWTPEPASPGGAQWQTVRDVRLPVTCCVHRLEKLERDGLPGARGAIHRSPTPVAPPRGVPLPVKMCREVRTENET